MMSDEYRRVILQLQGGTGWRGVNWSQMNVGGRELGAVMEVR